MRRCRNDECGRNIFPRIDPAVIMLVEQQNPDDGIPRCLLGRHHKLPQRIYSTLAGYVETGENLEEAVAREIREEAGISVSRVSYLGSQPWPFPSAMMVGFLASSPDREIVIAEDELEDARWFSAEEVRGFGEFDDAGSTRALPRKDSIARLLIQTWLDRVSVQDN
jgi:NAD+ diphosphatase